MLILSENKKITVTFLLMIVVGFIVGRYFFFNKIKIICDLDTSDNDDVREIEIANQLRNKTRILCWIETGPQNHQTRASHIKATWGQRCTILLFMSSVYDPDLPSVQLPVEEGRDNLWHKTKEGFKYVYKHYYNQADWFVKADDDTYIVVENLRYFLNMKNASDPVYFGCRFRPYLPEGYHSGSAYVLSKEALRRFVEIALPSNDNLICTSMDYGNEDVEMGKCLQNVNVTVGDGRDLMGRGRFLPFNYAWHLVPQQPVDFLYSLFLYYPEIMGEHCCSDTAISFHYLKSIDMHLMEYLLYHVHPYGIYHQIYQKFK